MENHINRGFSTVTSDHRRVISHRPRLMKAINTFHGQRSGFHQHQQKLRNIQVQMTCQNMSKLISCLLINKHLGNSRNYSKIQNAPESPPSHPFLSPPSFATERHRHVQCPAPSKSCRDHWRYNSSRPRWRRPRPPRGPASRQWYLKPMEFLHGVLVGGFNPLWKILPSIALSCRGSEAAARPQHPPSLLRLADPCGSKGRNIPGGSGLVPQLGENLFVHEVDHLRGPPQLKGRLQGF